MMLLLTIKFNIYKRSQIIWKFLYLFGELLFEGRLGSKFCTFLCILKNCWSLHKTCMIRIIKTLIKQKLLDQWFLEVRVWSQNFKSNRHSRNSWCGMSYEQKLIFLNDTPIEKCSNFCIASFCVDVFENKELRVIFCLNKYIGHTKLLLLFIELVNLNP